MLFPQPEGPITQVNGDGMLQLRSTVDEALRAQAKDLEKDVWVHAACISSQGPLARYGFYAARIKASRLSMTSSFWFQGKFSEIDVVEQIAVLLQRDGPEPLDVPLVRRAPHAPLVPLLQPRQHV